MTPHDAPDIPALVARLLNDALAQRASDLHVEPGAAAYDVRLRVDGVLQTARRVPAAVGRGVVTRLMVLAQLLTYRLDVPQEGRASFAPAAAPGTPIDLRVSIMPTTHGMRAVVRLPAERLGPRSIAELSLPGPVAQGLHAFAAADAGLLLLTGPAGSGKTTTIYALLSQIVAASPGLSVIALEDPVERDLPGVTQIEVTPFGELTYERALRSVLRQDPQVLMLGEIRDAATASLAVQAALSGHRLISTLHAGAPGGAVARLFEMGIEPYQVTSALFGVVSQRLLRRRNPDGGYRGRVPVAEIARLDAPLRQAILRRADAGELQQIISRQPGFQSQLDAARHLVEAGITDSAEVERVLGTADLRSEI